MNKFWVVFKRTFFKNVKSGGFYFMLLSPLLFLVIGYFIFNFINGEITQMNQGHIGVVGLAEEELDSLRSMTPEMTIDLLSEASGEAALQQDEISGYLVVSSDNNTVTYYTKNTSKEVSLKPIEQWFSMRARNELAGQIGISTEVAQRLSEVAVSVEQRVVSVDPKTGELVSVDKMGIDKVVRLGVAYILSFVVMMMIMSYSGIISQEIASEKGTRIMEVILSSVSASSHFFGKVVGILSVILIQLVIYSVLVVAGVRLPQVQNLINRFLENVDLWALLSDLAVASCAYFILGTLIFVALAAMTGSLVTKTEDAAKAMTPISLLGMIGFYIGMFALNAPNAAVSRISSFVPFFAPFVMPFRMASGTVDQSEVWLSLLIMVVTVIVILWLSVAFYRASVLVYSDKGVMASLKQTVTLMKKSKK